MSRTVLHLTPHPPVRSGIADYAREYRRAIERHTDWRGWWPETDVVAGNSPADLASTRRRVQQWLRRDSLREVALVHAEIGAKQHDQFWTVFWLQRLVPDLPCCITVHDPPLLVAPVFYPLACGSRASLVRRALRLLDYTPAGHRLRRYVLARARAVFALSSAGTESLRGLMADPARLRTLPFLAYGGSRPRECGGVARPTRLLFLGFWAPGKGLELLLGAAEEALARAPGRLQLVLAGGVEETGANRGYVESVRDLIGRSPVRQALELTGYVPGDRLDDVLADADVLVLPATRASSLAASSVLFRAMAAGLAIVASDVGAIREEVRHLETGLLLPAGNRAALRDAILLLVGDPALCARLGRAAQAHVRAEHDEATVARAASQVYASVARG